MSRVKRGVRTRARHHKILKQAKGYFGHTLGAAGVLETILTITTKH